MKPKALITAMFIFSLFIGRGCSCSKETLNIAPVIESLTANPATVYLSDTATLVCSADDPDGDILSYSWETVSGSINGTGNSILWIAPDNEGTFPVTVNVLDNKGGKDSETVNIEVKSPTLLYLKGGDPETWTIQGAVYSQYEEIQHWEAAGYVVTNQDFNTTTITKSLLDNFDVLRFHQGSVETPASVATAIHDWVVSGGNLIADINWAASAVSEFGVENIEGNHGGTNGLDWIYHGAPWTFGPVTGPLNSVNSMAAQAMDHPILSLSHNLIIDASVDGYPIVVHGEFGTGKVVIIFAQGWSHDATRPNNAYRATIFQHDNIQFLENCIKYFEN